MGSQGIKWSGVGIQRWINRYWNLRTVSLPVPGVSDANYVRVVSAMVVGARRFGDDLHRCRHGTQTTQMAGYRKRDIAAIVGIRQSLELAMPSVQLTPLLVRSSLSVSSSTQSPATISSSTKPEPEGRSRLDPFEQCCQCDTVIGYRLPPWWYSQLHPANALF